MRLVVFFDLPTETAAQRKSYRQFRKFLIKDGYLMMQQSVYSKMVLDGSAADAVVARLRKHRPSQGLVQVLRVTERQFSAMDDITGSRSDTHVIDTSDRLIVL